MKKAKKTCLEKNPVLEERKKDFNRSNPIIKSVWQTFVPRQKSLGDVSKTLQAQCPSIDQIAGPRSHNIFLSLILDTIDSKRSKDRLQLWLVFSLYKFSNN